MNTVPVSNQKLTASFLFGLRMVSGWLFFSAFWRRVVLMPEKLDPSSMDYVGIKFNTFLPHAVGIESMLEFLLTHQELLFAFLIIFTIIEGLCGLGLMLGFFTRLTALGTTCLSFGILLGAGWLGSTCLDEWQIGVAGIASGLTLMMMGSGYFSLDNLIFGSRLIDGKHRRLIWITSGRLPVEDRTLKNLGFWFGIIAIFITIWSNQVLHGGVWGKLFNYSKKTVVEVSNTSVSSDRLSFEVFRTGGSDVYGAFVIEMAIVDFYDNPVWKYEFATNGMEGNKTTAFDINNIYVSKVKTAPFSLEIPLGAKASITTQDSVFAKLPLGSYSLKLTDVSGLVWKQDFRIDR
ncbi:MAG: TQO small subunit DoxD [Bacteroidales bacterium]